MIENQVVSLFENIQSKKVIGETTIESWLKSDQHKDEVLRYRASSDKKEKDQILSELQAVSPCGTFDKSLSGGIAEYSNLCFLKVRRRSLREYGDVESVKRQLAGGMPELVYCGLSLSGKGLDVLINIHSESLEMPSDLIELHAAAATGGLVVECQDTKRMVASFDPDPYINIDAEALLSGEGFGELKRKSKAKVVNLIRRIKESGLSLSEGQVHDMGYEIAYVFGRDGLTLFNEFMNRDESGDGYDWSRLYEFHLRYVAD